MNTLIQVAHDLKSNTLEAVWFDSEGKQNCRNFSPLQIEEFNEVAVEHASRYTELAGWTPEYIAAIAAEEQRLADEARATQERAEQEAFDAEVDRQAKIMAAAKKIVDSKK